MNETVLATDSIARRFGPRRVLNAASIRVEAGSVTALLGRNGCGKTTLIRIINGFLRADSGVVFFNGRMRPRPSLHSLAAEGLFFIPERNLLSRIRSVGEHVEQLLDRFPNPRAATILDDMDMRPLLDRTVDRLSGGECRRAEIGLAMLREPRCLIADEPFLGIAPRDADRFCTMLRGMARSGCAVLITGHEVETMFEIADTVVWMTAGTTYTLGPPGRASRHEQFRREYLGPRGAAHLARGSRV